MHANNECNGCSGDIPSSSVKMREGKKKKNDCYLLCLLGCLAASSCQPGHQGVSAISNSLHGPGYC